MLNKLTDELAVCGCNAVAAVGEYHPEAINRLFLREDRLKSFAKVCKGLAERKRPYKICEDEELEKISKSSHHQGVVAMIAAPETAPLGREDLDAWADKGKTGLILHSVGNDHNLGAIARSAAFFDAPYIVISEGDSEARLSTSAYRIAEGGMEHVAVRSVRNTAAFIKEASQKIITIGTEGRARQRIRDLPNIIKELSAKLPGAGKTRPGIAIVLGNEETGLPKDVKDACSCLVRIPGTGIMESLNVAQAATLFLQEIFEL
ncbi:TrmH family RNA methyltransferase [Leadbettera azotonutricia]|uniref:RNA methyltransferase, TrmH family n=1 Tax=Leadbettera azotonutricia (strain ATCC BAA-888 / DSM 13862 / ZAS-9) TaxID=545695 RepID=F5YBB9_LEAAZ|nr:RNA methyltransferase [Leadbettera azotonutricia]AEF80574.1 RNA methyltransferase, TrmH family [Leadbettera azotonutricia ZAS-9]